MPREVRRKDWDSVTCLNPITMIHQCQHKVDGITKYLDTTEFSFDHSFDEKDDNDTVYRCTARPLIPFVLAGGNATVFAYGQTGSGKTYTMTALQEMAAEDIFDSLERKYAHENLTVTVSFFEIYGGRCIDLLNHRARLSIREDGRGNVVIGGLKEHVVGSSKSMLEVIHAGHAARATSKTEMNEASSRSHAICQVQIKERGGIARGKFSLIDLAGSERAADTKNHNRQRRVEGAEINKSLLALKECIRALDSRSRGHVHVPYRASKLTLVLKDSFSGSSRTVMICNISPGASATEHTLNTLRYADRVKQKEVKHAYNLESTIPDIGIGEDASADHSAVSETPMSPMGSRLKSVHLAARKGKISAEEKARMKDKIIAQEAGKRDSGGKRRGVRANGGLGVRNGRRGEQRRAGPVAPSSPTGKSPLPGRPEKKDTPGQGRQAGNPARRQWASKRERKPPISQQTKENQRGGLRNNQLQHRSASPPTNTPPKRMGGRRQGPTKLAEPVPSPHNKDLEFMHRSLRANRGNSQHDASAELLSLHETVSRLVEEEELLLTEHMDCIQENAELLTEEGRLLAKVQGEDVVDYDIDMYAERLDQILTSKISMYTKLHANLKKFRQHLADEENLSRAVGDNVQMY